MDRKQSIDLWNRCQNRKRELIDAGLDPEEAANMHRELWNEWARPLRQERDRLKKERLWLVDEKRPRDPRGLNDETKDWLSRARIDFQAVFFQRAEDDHPMPSDINSVTETVKACGSAIDFRGYIFPGTTNFELAVFEGWIWFQGSEFDGPISFDGARFANWAGFQDTTFRERASLKEVVFSDHAVFYNGPQISDR